MIMDNVFRACPPGLFEGEDNLLILGNGFDLDLGFPTSYKHFFESSYWPFVRGSEDYGELGLFLLNNLRRRDLWFNLEDALAEYGLSRATPKPMKRDENWQKNDDERDFNRLVTGLGDYLRSLDFTSLDDKSTAAKVLGAFSQVPNPGKIYTFNYTNVEQYQRSLEITQIQPHYIHGDLESKNIILGVGDYVKNLPPATDFMYKTNRDGYRSTELFKDLASFKTIIIFGLSMSKIDYPYFEDFFHDIISGKYEGDQRKYVRIVTDDEDSRRQILRNLREMNDGMIKLRNYADFDIIRTKDNIDEIKVLSMLKTINPEWKIDTTSDDEI